jgi:hypothetical protein
MVSMNYSCLMMMNGVSLSGSRNLLSKNLCNEFVKLIPEEQNK